MQPKMVPILFWVQGGKTRPSGNWIIKQEVVEFDLFEAAKQAGCARYHIIISILLLL
jgi:hypothetical protein